MVNLLDSMTEALAIEARSSLNYAVNYAWPTVVDKDDEAAMGLMRELWAKEEPFIEQLIELVADGGGISTLDATYAFAPSRLNFARASHLLGELSESIDKEIDSLEAVRAEVAHEETGTGGLDELIALKKEGVARLRELYEKQEAARAAAAAGAAKADTDTRAAGADDPMAFRDPDMPVEERMTVVEKQPLEMKLWAAMAQTDCTACGYDCEGYAKAIASGEETDLSKCVPGEDVTENLLTELVKQKK